MKGSSEQLASTEPRQGQSPALRSLHTGSRQDSSDIWVPEPSISQTFLEDLQHLSLNIICTQCTQSHTQAPPNSSQPSSQEAWACPQRDPAQAPHSQHTSNALATPANPPGAAVACILTRVLTPPAAPLPGPSAASKSFSAQLHTRRPEVRPRGPLSAGDRKGVFVLIYPPGGSDLPADVCSRLSTS